MMRRFIGGPGTLVANIATPVCNATTTQGSGQLNPACNREFRPVFAMVAHNAFHTVQIVSKLHAGCWDEHRDGRVV